MSNIIQNMKSGFANIKELFGILLKDDVSNEGYDLYINSSDESLSQTAQTLKQLEEEQEPKRFSIFNYNPTKKDLKKNFKSNLEKNESSQNTISSDVRLLDTQPEK